MENTTNQPKENAKNEGCGCTLILLFILGFIILIGYFAAEDPQTTPEIPEVQNTQPQTISPQKTPKVQKQKVCACVYRSCSDDSSCTSFCQSKGYDRCNENECWQQDPRFASIKNLFKSSAENYCQCSGKWDEGQYGQCLSTGSCDLVCSWSGQGCLKAGCSCCNYQ